MFVSELNILLWAGVLTLVQFAIAAVPGLFQTGIPYAVSPRDKPHTVTGIPGRLDRALWNHHEWLYLFAIPVIAITILGKSSAGSLMAAQVYLAARVIYVPLYAFGLPWIRTIVWCFGFLATCVLYYLALA